MNEEVDFKVENLVQNCHFCFKSFNDNRKPVKITETIEHQFLELTQCLVRIIFAQKTFLQFPLFVAPARRWLFQIHLYFLQE